MGISTPGESVSLERKIESSIFLCIPRDLNILGKSCTTFVIVKIVRNLSRGRSPCQRVNHVKSGVIYFSAFIFSYDTIHVSGTIHTWNRDLTLGCLRLDMVPPPQPHRRDPPSFPAETLLTGVEPGFGGFGVSPQSRLGIRRGC